VIRVKFAAGNAQVVASGASSQAGTTMGRSNTFSVTVTARDNITQKTYTVGVSRRFVFRLWTSVFGRPWPF
jgi:hypothetical protein